jgi:hypothetical protein
VGPAIAHIEAAPTGPREDLDAAAGVRPPICDIMHLRSIHLRSTLGRETEEDTGGEYVDKEMSAILRSQAGKYIDRSREILHVRQKYLQFNVIA